MVTKKRTTRRAAPRRAAPARRAAPRRRTKSGVTMIPSAMATAALVAVNAKPAVTLFREATLRGYDYGNVMNRLKNDNGTKAAVKNLIGANALIRDAAVVAGGYIGGEIVKKYAPSVIKSPLGKIAKKIPKVI